MSYENRARFLICYNNEPAVTLERFDSSNASTGSAALARNRQRKDVLNNPAQVTSWANAITALDEAVNAFKKALPYASTPDWHDIIRLIKNKVADRSAIEL